MNLRTGEAHMKGYTWLPVTAEPLFLKWTLSSTHSHILLSLFRTPLQLDLSPQPSHEVPQQLENRACLPKSSCPSTCELPLISVDILCTLALTQVPSNGVFQLVTSCSV